MQLETAVAMPTILGHVVVVQLLPAFALIGVHEATGVAGVVTGVQVVATQLLPGPAAAATHELTGVGPVVTVLQFVVV